MSTCVLICTLVQRCAFLMIIFSPSFSDPAKSTKYSFPQASRRVERKENIKWLLELLNAYVMNEKERKSLGLYLRVTKGKLK